MIRGLVLPDIPQSRERKAYELHTPVCSGYFVSLRRPMPPPAKKMSFAAGFVLSVETGGFRFQSTSGLIILSVRMFQLFSSYQSKTQRLFWHLLFWVSYAGAYVLIYGSFADTYIAELNWMLTSLPVKMMAVYFSLYFVIPRYFLHKKYVLATVFSLGSIVVASFLQRIVDFELYYPYFNPRGLVDDFWYLPKILKIALGIYPVVALASFIKITKHFYSEESRSNELKQQKLEAELKFLKGQVHPHFLFNTLNNLYALTLKKSDASPEVVLKLSELLSFMLYECNSPTVPLSKELKLIENYIALEKIRYDDRLTTSYKVEGETEAGQIPPMLLLPFVENAFKHGTSDTLDKVWVEIKVAVRNNVLSLTVQNSNGVEKSTETEFEYQQGIGLKNVKRRLDLLYGENYELHISDEAAMYSVALKLQLDALREDTGA
jgi:two-component system LytT family sensor kinase